MSQNLKLINFGNYDNDRKNSVKISNGGIKNKEKYLLYQEKTPEACDYAMKAHYYPFYQCKLTQFEFRGKFDTSHPATYRTNKRFKTNNEKRIFDKIIHSALTTDSPLLETEDSYSMQNTKSTADLYELKQYRNLNETITDLALPEEHSKSYITPKWKIYYEDTSMVPINTNFGSNEISSQNSILDWRLPTALDYIRPYDKIIAVYTVQTHSNRKKEAIYCGTNNAFKLQFYKNKGDSRCISKGGSIKHSDGVRPGFRSGDGRAMSKNAPGYRRANGRPMSIDGPAYISSDRPAICKNGMILIPKGYSVTRLRRDEDGCICTDIPEADYGFRNGHTRNGSFLKKYFQVLMKENTRCICGKRNQRHVCPYPTCKRNVNNVGCQCKCNNAEKTGFGNDAACQCRYKEKREPRPDRESFFTERALTCCVPVIPTECSKCSFEHKFNPNSKQEEVARRTVNIGSNFSFKLGFYKGANYKPVCPTPCDPCCPSVPVCCQTSPDNAGFMPIPACRDVNQDSSCSCSSAGHSRIYKPFCSSPKLTWKSNSTQSKASVDHSCRCSSKPSTQTVCCCPPPPPKRCFSPCVTPHYEMCPSKAKSTNKGVRCCRSFKPAVFTSKKNSEGSCCNPCVQPACTESKHSKNSKMKDASCLCCGEKPTLVECTDNIMKNEKCGPCCSAGSERRKRKSKFSRIKNTACHCNIKPIIFKCTNKEKGVEICCNKCKRPKKVNENYRYCCCDENKKQQSEPTNKEPATNLGIFSSFRNKKKENVSKEPVLTKDAKCSCTYQNKIEGEFDYRSVLKKIALTNRAHKIQCACKNEIDCKKKFGRLILFNIRDKACCSSETCGLEENHTPIYKNVGIGDVDLRKPPCMRRECPNKQGQTILSLKKIFYRLIKNPTCTIKQKRIFDPLNQTETAVQHIGSDNQNQRLAREIVCRDQGSYAPLSIPTVKEYETNPAYAPPEPYDPNKKHYRLGSSCSFCIELYRGPPKSKTAAGSERANAPCGDCPPCIPCPPTCSTTANHDAPCEECSNVSNTNEALLVAQKAFASLLLRKKKHVANKTTMACPKCNKCVKVPLIKRGFAQILLTDPKQRKAEQRTCQKTNTASPVRKIVKRRPGNSTGDGNGKTNCDPYVCLKRINKDKCCNKR